MKRTIAAFFLILLMAVGYSCKDDIIITPPNEIIGKYFGEYRVVRNVPTGTQTKRARIEWNFKNGTEYDFQILETLQGNDLCPSFGNYALEERIALTNAQNPPPCTGDDRDYPDGEFVLQRYPNADSLYMLQIVTDPDTGWTKELFLKRDTTSAEE